MTKAFRKTAVDLARAGDYKQLFIEQLGWDHTPDDRIAIAATSGKVSLVAVAEKRGIRVFAGALNDADLPEGRAVRDIDRQLKPRAAEYIAILRRSDGAQLWMWCRGVGAKQRLVRVTRLFPMQSGEALSQKLLGIRFSISEEYSLRLPGVQQRTRAAFDLETVTRQFYEEYKTELEGLAGSLRGVAGAATRRWYASVTMNRLMFLYFIQYKGFLNEDRQFLLRKFEEHAALGGKQSFFRAVFLPLCHEALGGDHANRGAFGRVPYVNGGLFSRNDLETETAATIDIPDHVFSKIFALFDSYEWHLDQRELVRGNEINPDVIGYIFEKFVNQEETGAFYTKEDVTRFVGVNSICTAVLRKLSFAGFADRHESAIGRLIAEDATRYEIAPQAATIGDGAGVERGGGADGNPLQLLVDLIESASARAHVDDILRVLEQLSVIDPTCGSGAFLFAALNVLFTLYDACNERLAALDQRQQSDAEAGGGSRSSDAGVGPSRDYAIYKAIIVNNLYGVDIMEEAVEICKLRLFLKLAAQVEDVAAMEPLPDIDFNIRVGNALYGFASEREASGVGPRQRELRADLPERMARLESAQEHADALFAKYRKLQVASAVAGTAVALREELSDAYEALRMEYDQWLYEVTAGRRKFENWRSETKPFHWIVEFHATIKSGGFDVVIGNPPFVRYDKNGPGYDISAFATADSRNLYALALERSLGIVRRDGQVGMIVPLSITFSRDFRQLRRVLLGTGGSIRISNYDNIPDRLFTGYKKSENTSTANQQRISIILVDRSVCRGSVASTGILRWRSVERPALFERLEYSDVTELAGPDEIPKVPRERFVRLYETLRSQPRCLGEIIGRTGAKSLYVPQTASYYIAAYPEALPRTGQQVLHFSSQHDRDLAMLLINSGLFFWYWRVRGDSFHVTGALIKEFPLIGLTKREVEELGAKLVSAIPECLQYKAYRGKRVPNVNFNRRLDLLRDIDAALLGALGITDVSAGDLLWAKSSSFLNLKVAKSASEEDEEDEETG